MSIKRWTFAKTDNDTVERLCKEMDISRLAGITLVSRGITCKQEAEKFLSFDYALGDAMLMKDMGIAVQRVHKAIDNGEKIVVFGDYDVDGIMSTALICQYLESVGADVVPLLPKRDSTGYGLVRASVDEIIALNAELIITVDNGISSRDAIAYAKQKGIDTIVCDHHIAPETLPDAVAVIDPHQENDESLFKPLAGVGVTLKFVSAIEQCDVEEMLEHYGYFAAIGTIADVMPLVGENRVIVSRGLSQLAYEKNLGLSALMEEVGLDTQNVSAQNIAYMLAPRINAAGRMGDAQTALRLMMTEDAEEAAAIAGELTELNNQRQKIEQEMTANILDSVSKDSEALSKPILVVSGYDFNSGVSGIVCSRLVDRFAKPIIIITMDEIEARGSGRSIEGFSLYNAISGCAELLMSFGGHDMAAGFTIAPDKIELFKNEIEKYCRGMPEPVPYEQTKVCGEISFLDIGERQIEQLMQLAPFGPENNEPVFATLSAKMIEVLPLAEYHSLLTFEKEGKRIKAALFSVTPNELPFKPGDFVDIAYVLSLYTSKEKIRSSVKIKCIVPAGFSKEDFSTIRIYDRMCCNQKLSRHEMYDVLPSRDDIAFVYRSIKENPINGDAFERVCYRFFSMTPGKALTAVKVLKELGLLIEKSGEEQLLSVAKNPVKKKLEMSGTFSMLADSLNS